MRGEACPGRGAAYNAAPQSRDPAARVDPGPAAHHVASATHCTASGERAAPGDDTATTRLNRSLAALSNCHLGAIALDRGTRALSSASFNDLNGS
jgi:hypothetical protein